MASIRQKKVAAQIQRITATVLQREVSDPRVDGLVTVTKVEISPDLREAKVFLSVLGGKKTPQTVIEGIKAAGRHIQGAVAKDLAMRFAPRLTYVLDETLKKQAEILKKIGDVMAEHPTPPAPGAPPAPPAPNDEGKEAP
jgi:ribosome-binding factor A